MPAAAVPAAIGLASTGVGLYQSIQEGNKLKVEFSSRNEEEVINYLKNK